MKLFYIAHARIPTEKAHGINMVQMCAAFATAGGDVTMVLPKRKNPIQKDVFDYYGVKRNFSVKCVPSLDWVSKGRIGFTLSWLSFAWKTLCYMRAFKKTECVIVTRDELTGWMLSLFGYNVCYDMHGFPETSRFWWKRSMRSMNKLVVTNNWKKEQCEQIFGIDSEKILVAPNGFNPETFVIEKEKGVLREELGLPKETPIALYAGHLYDWKGVDVMAVAAKELPHVSFVFVGGKGSVRDAFVEKYSAVQNIISIPHQQHTKIPQYLAAADVLVLPNTTASASKRLSIFSKYDTSPIKMFEYMASGVPIVASDLPSMREILTNEHALLVEENNPSALAAGIHATLENREAAEIRARHAQTVVQEYTWDKRAARILTFCKK